VAEALGQAVLTLAVDDRQYKAGLDQSKRLAEQTGTQINRSLQVKGGGLFGDVGAELGALKGGLASGALAAAGVAVAVGAIGYATIQAAGDAQKLTAAFTGLTGSASAAAALRQELFTLSKATPFKNDELLSAAQRFLAVGVEAENLGGTINRIGALAAQSGQSLDRVGLIYAQVFAKGRLQGEENLQFLEAGIDLNSQLAKVTGLSGQALQDAMSKGKISLNDVNQAIVLATGSMAALEGAGQSVSVKFANIGDNVQQVFLGFAQAITPALSAAFDVINKAFDRLFPSLESITQFFSPLTKEAQRFAELLEKNPRVVEALALAFESLLNTAITPILEGIGSINEGLEKNPQGLIDGIIGLELRLRQAALTASGLIKIITAPARFGGLLSGEARTQVAAGLKDIGSAASAKPIEVPVNLRVQDQKTAALAGDLTDKLAAGVNEESGKILDSLFKQNVANLQIDGILDRIDAAKQLATLEGTALLVLQKQLAIEDKKREAKEAELALERELAKPAGDGKNGTRSSERVDDLLIKQQQANAEVLLAYQEAGASLAKNAKTAAESLKDAQKGVQGVLRGGFDFLTKGLQQQQLARARASVQPLVDRGIIRQGIDISTPDKLFSLAGFADSFSNSEKELGKALAENTAAQQALATKDWNVVVQVPGGAASGDVVGAVNSRL
jgi:tape measure domain-containing protein